MTAPRHGTLLGNDRPDTPAAVAARFVVRDPNDTTPQGASAVPVQFPPHFIQPAYGAQGVYGFGSASVGPGPANWGVPAALPFQTPPNNVTVIRSWGFSIANNVASSNISGVLRVNGGGLAPKRQLPASANPLTIGNWDDVIYVTQKGALVDVMMTVSDGGTYTLTAWFSGWTMAESLFRQLLGVAS